MEITIHPIKREVARPFIETYHYTRSAPALGGDFDLTPKAALDIIAQRLGETDEVKALRNT